MKLKKTLIFLLIVLAVIGGGFLVWKYAFKKEEKQSDSSNSDNPDPVPNPAGKLTQAELEKYLLEKRLDLQKYFVFNLGELKTNTEAPIRENNSRKVSESLGNDLDKLSASYEKKLEEKGKGLILGNITINGKKLVGWRVKKDYISFTGRNFEGNVDEE
jgi:hypothetical protein